MITCEIIVEEIGPGRAQMAVLPKPVNPTPLEEIHRSAKEGGSIIGDLSLEPVVRRKMEDLRKGRQP